MSFAEARVGGNEYVENSGVEMVGEYVFTKDDVIQAYAGFGGRIRVFEGVVVQVGLHIYPFDHKNFGFHSELAALFSSDESPNVLRGSRV